MRWPVGFVFHKIAFGLLSLLLPLYITQVVSGGSLTIWGIITASATFLAIPFSFLWGYLCDTTQHYRFFILMSFAVVALLLYLFSTTSSLGLLGILYACIVIFQVAHETPKNVLIAETYSHTDWKKAFARYESLTELGWIIGLLLGFLLLALGIDNTTLLLFCAGLILISFLASLIFVTDPALIFERGLVSIEKSVSLIQRGATLLSRSDSNMFVWNVLRQENVSALCFGLVFFSLASSMFFTPLPIFFARVLGLQTTMIFILFVFSSASCLLGFLMTLRKADYLEAKTTMKRSALLRGFLVLAPVFAWIMPFSGAILLFIVVLAMLGSVYAFYSVSVISLSMEVIPPGKAGLFTALVSIGAGIGCLSGPLLAESFGFGYVFFASAACFFLSFVSFNKFA